MYTKCFFAKRAFISTGMIDYFDLKLIETYVKHRNILQLS